MHTNTNLIVAKEIEKAFQKYREIEQTAFLQLQTEVYQLLKNISNAEEIDYTEDFVKKLTTKEKEALIAIIDELQEGSGRISVVKMMQKTGHSRPVYDSLLDKMQEYSVANITRQGVKGTLIEIFNKDLRIILEQEED